MKKLFLCLFVLVLISCGQQDGQRTVAIGFMGSFSTFDPYASSEHVTFTINANVFESLVRFDNNLAIQPALAKSWENVDPRTWIFHLREGVLFHNGDTLTAEDVEYSLLRAKDHPESEYRGYLMTIDGIEVLDRWTIKLHTVKTDYPLLNKLSGIAILSKNYTEHHDDGHLRLHPNGTGPYKLSRWKSPMELTYFRQYWGKEPPVEKVTFYFFGDLEDAIEHLLGGKIDILNNFPCDHIEKIDESDDVELVYTPGLSVRYLGFNMRSPVFGRKEVRKAIYHALNRKALIDSVKKGYAKAATQLLNPQVYGYNPEIMPIPYDTLEATKLLRKAGLGGDLNLDLVYFAPRKKLGEMIKRDLERIGISVTLRPLPPEELLDAIKKGRFDAYVAAFVSNSGDAEEGLLSKLHSRDSKRNYGLLNYEGFKNRDVDFMIENLEEASSPSERLAMMKSIMAVVMEEIPSIPLFVSEDLYAKRKYIVWKPRLDGIIRVDEISRKDSAE
jgi:peptide/nickel transport system substrate-binding protein